MGLYIDEEEYALLRPRPVIVAGDTIEEHVLSEQVIDVGVPIGADWDPTSSVTLTIDPRGFGCVNHVVT